MIFAKPKRIKQSLQYKIKSKLDRNKNKNLDTMKTIDSEKIIISNSPSNITCICNTIVPILDNDNTFDGLVLPLPHGWTIWYFSHIHIFTALYAFINTYYLLSFFGFGSFATSLNYWKYPHRYSWRRYCDICFIQLTFYVHLYYALMMTTGISYMYFSGIGIICYGISNYYTRKNIFFATYFHILVHVFASIGNSILYSGKIK